MNGKYGKMFKFMTRMKDWKIVAKDVTVQSVERNK